MGTGEKWSSHVSRENRGWTNDEVEDNFFKGKTIVISGELTSFPIRDELAGILKGLGAKVTSAVSAKTNVLVMGYKPGPAKLDRVDELRVCGCAIYIMMERELLSKLEEALGGEI